MQSEPVVDAAAELKVVKERVDSLIGVMEEMKKEVIEYGSANRAVAALRAGTFNEVREICPSSLLAALMRVPWSQKFQSLNGELQRGLNKLLFDLRTLDKVTSRPL